jgi:AbrB family looped-hinge helix DNA binding protein
MLITKMDRKGRIQLPKAVRRRLDLKKNETFEIKINDTSITIKPTKDKAGMDSVLRDMIEHPLHSKAPVTKELLDKLADGQWSGL